MEKEVKALHKHMARSKIALYAVVGFLALLTYLLITISTQLAQGPITSDADARARRVMSRNGGIVVAPSPTPLPKSKCDQICYAIGNTFPGQPMPKEFKNECEAGLKCDIMCGLEGECAGVCRPENGGSCPAELPMSICDGQCADGYGNLTHTCPAGTFCSQPIGLSGTCKPVGGASCMETIEATEPINVKIPAPLPIARCGEVCIPRSTNQDGAATALCAPGLTCQTDPSNPGGSYMMESRCYPAGQYGSQYCSQPSSVTRPGGSGSQNPPVITSPPQ